MQIKENVIKDQQRLSTLLIYTSLKIIYTSIYFSRAFGFNILHSLCFLVYYV